MRSVGVLTLGCKVNAYESEYVIDLLKKAGYEIKNFSDTCDIYIINTCTVTNTSDVKSRKMIRNAIRKNPHACVVAMGCFIEANKDFNIEGLDIIIGNKDKSKIVELLDEYFSETLAAYPPLTCIITLLLSPVTELFNAKLAVAYIFVGVDLVRIYVPPDTFLLCINLAIALFLLLYKSRILVFAMIFSPFLLFYPNVLDIKI